MVYNEMWFMPPIACCANLIIRSAERALPYLLHELEDFTRQIWKVSLQGLVHKRYASKVYDSITPKSINQNSTPFQIWLKKDF